MRTTTPITERFWANVSKTDGCWEWRGTKAATGYGVMGVGQGKVLAHRLSHELLKGPIPTGMQVDHLCRNRACVSPDHLEAVTQAENVRRQFAAKTHCKWGHPREAGNSIQHGSRTECRECNRRRCQEYAARRKSARTS